MGSPVLRFSPAPTGWLHVGHARTALFNWLHARHHGGRFVLRIEDTDPARSREEYVHAIERSLRWLGLDWDEGPIRQSSRTERYLDAAGRLLDAGRAYACDCSRADLEARLAARRAGGAKVTPGYDGHCRDRGLAPGPGRALRFATPEDGSTTVEDLVRGEVTFAHDTIEDFVILRADGTPGFLVANAVDDADMGITHVVRGEDLLSSTPRVLLLRRALGIEGDPVYAHLPMIVDERRQKLSSRWGAVSVEEYRSDGYLPEAMRNHLALLGWAPGDDREVLTLEELVAEFSIEAVNRSPAYFDPVKLAHLNATYLRALPVEAFVAESLPWLESEPPWPPERFEVGRFRALAPLVQERVRTLAEVPRWVDFLFLDAPEVDEASWAKAMAHEAAPAVLAEVTAGAASCPWEADALHGLVREVGARHGLGLAKAQAPVRVAVTGRAVGPPLFESMAVLGREATLARLEAASARLAGPGGAAV